MFFESFKVTAGAVAQLFFLGAIGYILVRREVLGHEGLKTLSRLVVEIVFPAMIFTQLVRNFSFSLYPEWWIFPLISILIIAFGFIVGSIFLYFLKGTSHKEQFLGLVAFQNSGYLPLGLIASLLPQAKADVILIYLFLLLLGFDLLVWSFGVYLLTAQHSKKFELASIFSPPVIANLFALALVGAGLNKAIPSAVMKPLELIAGCTLPLAMFVVGGNIATFKPEHIDKKAVSFISLAKLIIMPAVGLWAVLAFKLPELIGLLIIMQLAMPSATSLSVIIRHYHKEDLLISQGVFFSHIISIITIPLFLSLYFTLSVLK